MSDMKNRSTNEPALTSAQRFADSQRAAAPQSDQPLGTCRYESEPHPKYELKNARQLSHACVDWKAGDRPAQGASALNILTRLVEAYTGPKGSVPDGIRWGLWFEAKKFLEAAPASQPVAPPSGADARELAADWWEQIVADDECCIGHPEGAEFVDEKIIPKLAALLESFRAETEERAANRMLDMVVSSLKGYPNHGGDIGVMAEVERIEKDARAETLEQAAQVCDKLIRNEEGYGDDTHGLFARLAWTAPRIRALSPDPNWLARQIIERELETIYSVQSILMESKNLKHAISQVDGMRTRLDLAKAELVDAFAERERGALGRPR